MRSIVLGENIFVKVKNKFFGLKNKGSNNALKETRIRYRVRGKGVKKNVGLSSRLIEEEALKRGLGVFRYSGFLIAVYDFSEPKEKFWFHDARPSNNSGVSSRLAGKKELASTLLSEWDVVVPVEKVFRASEKEGARKYINYRYREFVLKGNVGSKGRRVAVDLNEANFSSQWEKASKGVGRVLVQQKVFGREYRVTVINGEFVAALERRPPSVYGDGVLRIGELINRKNETRGRNPHLYDKPIIVDEEVSRELGEQGFTLNSIPSKGLKVELRRFSANFGAGSDSVDASGCFPEHVRKACIRAVRAFPSLTAAAIDVVCESNPENGMVDRYWVLEINSNPAIGGHHYPMEGESINVAARLVDIAVKSLSAY